MKKKLEWSDILGHIRGEFQLNLDQKYISTNQQPQTYSQYYSCNIMYVTLKWIYKNWMHIK